MDDRIELARLLVAQPHRLLAGDVATLVRNVRTDSRKIEPGDVFVCLPGYRREGGEQRADRHEFIAAAVANGAAALVVDREVTPPPGVTVVQVDDGWHAAAMLACERFAHPSLAMKMVGITGTSGKTSTSYFVESILAGNGWRAARLGTIDYSFGGERLAATQTTPEADELQQLLRRAVDAGMQACVMEVSSHALELRRVAGVAFDVAVFTNLSQDHLNFHPDMHAYLRAKGRLFQELESGGKRATAVVNTDDPHSAHIIRVNRGALVTYGVAANATVRARDVETDLSGTRFAFDSPSGSGRVAIRHIGEYQVHNALAAIGVGIALGIPLDRVIASVEATPDVPGRFELVDEGQDFRVVVDYAHKPDALERLLRGARELDPNRVIVVFGCGGDRDRGKRPQMGRLAKKLADVVVVTSDNPRSEDPQAIVDEIVTGCTDEPYGAEVIVEPDREAAIRAAIAMAEASDLVLIAGKGHETYQLTAAGRIDFDDREHARRALRARSARAAS